MEEWVGFKWHEYITRHAMGEFPEHAVHLKDEARTLGVLFRALGGDPALSLVVAEPRHFRTRRRFLQKLAGTHRKFELAWRDEQSLRLPDRLALFPSQPLNRDLYLWLAALAAQGHRAVLLFCVAHEGIEDVAPATHLDPAYAATLREVVGLGVEVLARRCEVIREDGVPMAIRLGRRLPVSLSREVGPAVVVD